MLREPFDPKRSSSSPAGAAPLRSAGGERIPLEGLPAALSPALQLFRSGKSPGRGGHRVSLAPHHWASALLPEPLQHSPGQGEGRGGHRARIYAPNQENPSLGATGQESPPFFGSTLIGCWQIFRPVCSFSIRCGQRKSAGKWIPTVCAAAGLQGGACGSRRERRIK